MICTGKKFKAIGPTLIDFLPRLARKEGQGGMICTMQKGMQYSLERQELLSNKYLPTSVV
jgi:hypothetical protein